MLRSMIHNAEEMIQRVLSAGFSIASATIATLTASTRVTTPIVGTTTAVDPVFQRNSVERFRLTSDGPEIRGTAPLLGWNETDGASQEKFWWAFADGGVWRLDAISDDLSSAARAISVERTGVAIDSVRIGATAAPVGLDVTGGVALASPGAIRTSTGATLARTDFLVRFNTTGGDITVNLPSAVTHRGVCFAIRKTAAGNTLTIEPDGAETINGAANLAVTSVGTTFIISDGTEWITIGTMS